MIGGVLLCQKKTITKTEIITQTTIIITKIITTIITKKITIDSLINKALCNFLHRVFIFDIIQQKQQKRTVPLCKKTPQDIILGEL